MVWVKAMFVILALAIAAAGRADTFAVKGKDFVLNGKPFVIRSGEIHYSRVPHQYWRHRLRAAKAMGLNTICTYIFWADHEPTPGKWDFKGDHDLPQFIKIAQEEGLYVLLRPGPYACAERDFGGFPAWLLRDPKMIVRSTHPGFIAAAQRYLKKIGDMTAKYEIAKGGPILMVQVENEYGSYGSDMVYKTAIRDAIRAAGFSGELFTSDGPGMDMLRGGTLPDVLSVVNFGSGAVSAFETFAQFRQNVPLMIGEYWCGWFDHWGKKHHTRSAASCEGDLRWCLKNGASFNLYMFHGGTNFGFTAGANGSATDYGATTTSYDYDSPLSESGEITEKYKLIRRIIQEETGEKLTDIPEAPSRATYGEVRFKPIGSTFAELPKPIAGELTTFEAHGQAFGGVLLRTELGPGSVDLDLAELQDYAIVWVNGDRAGTLERRTKKTTLALSLTEPKNTIDIWVETLARINFGGQIIHERKGLTKNPIPGAVWQQYPYPLTTPPAATKTQAHGPKIYRANLAIKEAHDTFLDMRNFGKGFVWVNGRNLGRYWRIGPQQTLYLPAPWLKPGDNEIVIWDDQDVVNTPVIVTRDEPILDEVIRERILTHRKADETLDLANQAPVAEGELPASKDWQLVRFPQTNARYLCLETTSEQRGNPWSTLAEFRALGPDGKEIDRSKMKVLYADSEEVEAEDNNAGNVIDNQPTTIWHTEWAAESPKHPHYLVIDLGDVVPVASVRLLPRQESANGRIKGYRVYASTTLFKGLKDES